MSSKQLVKLQVRPNYVDEVYRVLLDAISDGSLAPGTRITQEEVAEQLNVSRSPVLQAMQLLKKNGLLQDAEGRGVMVAPLDINQIRHLYEIRSVLEVLAARLAAERKEVIDRDLIVKGRQIAQSNIVRAMIDADEAFHKAIYKASGNPLIALTAEVHWAHLRRVMGALLQSEDQRMSVWDEHEKLADAIETGDVKIAVSVAEEHMESARVKLLSGLETLLNA